MGTDNLAGRDEPITLTADGGLVLRQLSARDDESYFDLQKENRGHIAEYGNRVYDTLSEIRDARLQPRGKVAFGIWAGMSLVGIAELADREAGAVEVGVWIARKETGRGLATAALHALIGYANSKFDRIIAEVAPGNAKSIKLLKRCGFAPAQDGQLVQRDWGKAIVIELKS